MSKLRPLQKSFKSGEITPKLRSRPDKPEYQQGVEVLDNFLTSPYGTAIRRPGSEMIDEVSDTLIDGRIFTFRVEAAESYIIAVTEDELTVYDRNGQLPATPSAIINPSFNDGDLGWNSNLVKQFPLTSITQEPFIGFTNGTCSIASGNAAQVIFSNDPEPIPSVVLNPSSAELTQQILGVIAGNENTLKLLVANNSFSAIGVLLDYLSIGTTEGASDIPFTVDPLDSATAVFTPPGTSFWISYKLDWDQSLNISVAGNISPGPGNIGDSASVVFDAFILTDTVLPATLVVTFPSPWSAQQVRELQVEKAPGQSIMYFAVRADFTTKKLTFDRANNIWDLVDVVFTGDPNDPPEEWILTGYPGCISFFQGRMWLAGSLGHPATVWGSQAGEDNYENFSIGGAADDDALELPLARDGVIVWIQGGKGLHIGTENAEHVVIGDAEGTLIIPGNARTIQQSSYGSYRIHGKWLSEKISFVSNDQRRLYVGDYNRDTLGFLSDELSYMAEHITAPGLIETVYSQNPRAHVWGVRTDGVVVGCTYQRETDSVGWHRHTTPTGLIKSITITEEFGRSVPWILVERQNRLLLERFSSNVFVDSHIIRQYDPPQNVVDGLVHLEGLVVDVIGDGAYYGRHVVVGGEVTTVEEAQTFVVGIPYISTLKTLPIEVLHQSDNLTDKLVRWSRIYVRLLNAILPKINGKRPPTRTAPTPMNTREPNKTHDISVSTNGWDRDGSILIEQDLPFPCEVVGLYGELSEDGF